MSTFFPVKYIDLHVDNFSQNLKGVLLSRIYSKHACFTAHRQYLIRVVMISTSTTLVSSKYTLRVQKGKLAINERGEGFELMVISFPLQIFGEPRLLQLAERPLLRPHRPPPRRPQPLPLLRTRRSEEQRGE